MLLEPLHLKNIELDELYISVALKSLATSFIQIFVPVYLYQHGFGISEISLYYLIFFSTVAILMPMSMRLNHQLGVKKVLSLGTVSLAGYYLILNYIGTIHYSIIALTFGISVALYFSAFHIIFSKYSDKSKEASEFSMVQMIIRIATTSGPLLGAIFVTEVSFTALFMIVSGLLLVSVFPLFLTKDFKVHAPKFSLRRVFKSDTKKKAIVYISCGVLNMASTIFWPLFIFLTLKTVFSLGFIASVTSFFLVIFLFIIGKMTDKHKEDVLGAGIIAHSLSWLTRLFFLSPIGVFFNNFIGSLSSMMLEIPLSKKVYQDSKKASKITDYFMFREFHLVIGRMVILVIAFITGSLYWVFGISFIVTFAYTFLRRY